MTDLDTVLPNLRNQYRVAPYVGLNFTFYELLKVYFTPHDRPPSTLRKLSCGATAGAISQTLTYPLDVLRRKMQVTGMKDKVDCLIYMVLTGNDLGFN